MSKAQRRPLRRSGYSAASSAGGSGGVLVARATCACFNASKIRLIVRHTTRLGLVKPKTKYSEHAPRGKAFRVPVRMGNPGRESRKGGCRGIFSSPLALLPE